jgi:hypothetical protein
MVQDLVPGGTRLTGQQVPRVDHSARRELDADRLANHLQLVYDVEHPLPGGVVLDDQVLGSEKNCPALA